MENGETMALLGDVFEAAEAVGRRAYLWGGVAVDVLNGEWTRAHDDIDCFLEGLADCAGRLGEECAARGCEVKWLNEFTMLQIRRAGARAAFNDLHIVDGIAHWRHAGAHGTVFFPAAWLDEEPRLFYGARVRTAGPLLLYAVKRHPELLSPLWKGRDKDAADLQTLARHLRESGHAPEDIYGRVFSHNPIWYAQGYAEYFLPIVPRA